MYYDESLILTPSSIEKGKITNRKWDDISLDGWELAAKCSLKEMTIRGIHAGATEAEKAEILKTRDKQLADVNRHYLAPADYSVERLFASLASCVSLTHSALLLPF